MPEITVIAPTTSAVSSTKREFNAQRYTEIIVSADNLAGAEEVDIYKNVGGTWKAVTDSSGTAQTLTASKTMLTLAGGPNYGFLKDSTASACGVYVDVGQGVIP